MKTRISYLYLIITILILQSTLYGEDLYIYKENESQIFEKVESIVETKNLDEFYSTKRLGSFCQNSKTTFRLFTPNAKAVKLFLYKDPSDELSYSKVDMIKDEDGVWETVIEGEQQGVYYGYKVSHSEDKNFESLPLCIDPYAKVVTSNTDYYNPRKSIVYKADFEIGNDCP